MVGSRAAELRVLYVSEAYTPHDRRFLAAMTSRLGATAWLCLGDGDSRWEARAVPEGVQVMKCAPARRPGQGLDLLEMEDATRRASRDWAPDLVHAGPVPTAGLAAVRAGRRPAVVMSWGSDVLLATEGGAELQADVRGALEGCRGFVADARCVEEAAARLGLPASTPRATFPWGVDAALLAPPSRSSPIRRRLGWEEEHVCIATRAWKTAYRIDVLLDAFETASARDPKLRLLLLGDGDLAPAVRSRVLPWAAKGLAHMPGQVSADAVRPWFEAADLYLSAVPSDGSSISLLEAMATALPAVVVDAPGNREWIEHGRSGWLVAPNSADALAEGIRAAFDVRALGRMGEWGREAVIARADWARNTAKLFALYEQIAGSGRSS